MRRYVVAFLIGSAVVLNPIVFTLLMPAVGRMFGAEGDAFVVNNQTWMTAVATGYFVVALTGVFALRPRTQPRATRSGASAQRRVVRSASAAGEPSRGPGGGKKRKKGEARTNTGKRKRTQLQRGGSGKGSRQTRGR